MLSIVLDKNVVHVAVAVIVNDAGDILIQKRAEDTHQGGLWEFPGGKLEKHEGVLDALKREIQEELGINVKTARPLIKITHHYGDRSVLLDVHRVSDWLNEPKPLEGQPLAWVRPSQLSDYPMPAADVPIVNAINLPASYVITPPQIEDHATFLRKFTALLEQGERLFLYRVKRLKGISHQDLYAQISMMAQPYQAEIVIHETNLTTLDIENANLHLTEATLSQSPERNFSNNLLAVSCHSLDTILKAQDIGADFAMLSPVNFTRSHPEVTPIGWKKFSEIVERVNIPVYALGGMGIQDIDFSWKHGAQGVAGISCWWS